MLELLRYLAASKRPAAPCMVMGRMSAVGGVLRSKAYILVAPLEVAVESTATQCTSIHSPTDKEEAPSQVVEGRGSERYSTV